MNNICIYVDDLTISSQHPDTTEAKTTNVQHYIITHLEHWPPQNRMSAPPLKSATITLNPWWTWIQPLPSRYTEQLTTPTQQITNLTRSHIWHIHDILPLMQKLPSSVASTPGSSGSEESSGSAGTSSGGGAVGTPGSGHGRQVNREVRSMMAALFTTLEQQLASFMNTYDRADS